MALKPTDVAGFVSELGAGVLEEKLAVVISEVAESVCEHGRKGTITLKIELERIGQTRQVEVGSTLSYKRAKWRGTISEDDKSDTAMHVNEGGNVTAFPTDQRDMFAPSSSEGERA